MKHSKWTLGLIVCLLLVAGVFAWLFRPEPIEVETSRIQRGPFTLSIEEDGITRVRDRYVVTTPVAGLLLRPALRAGDVRRAARLLAGGSEVVLAPAEDGGYVLIGARRVRPALFSGIEWGAASVYRATTERLSGTRWRALRELWDIDRPQDWSDGRAGWQGYLTAAERAKKPDNMKTVKAVTDAQTALAAAQKARDAAVVAPGVARRGRDEHAVAVHADGLRLRRRAAEGRPGSRAGRACARTSWGIPGPRAGSRSRPPPRSRAPCGAR